MIPKFDMYHEHLYAGFMIFDRYLGFLNSEFINGFVLAENNHKKMYFFLFEGELLSAFSVSKNRTESEIQLIRDFVIPKDCFISTCRCPHTYVDYFSNFHAATLMYNNVSADKISPEKLVDKFEKERFSGFLEKNSTGSSFKKSYLYFNKGEMIGGLYLDKKDGGLERGFGRSQVLEKMKGALFSIYGLAPKHRDPKKERALIIKCFQDIFRMMETRVDPSEFSTLWRKCAMELSHKYEFLDPMIGEFQYKNQQIHLYEKINLKPAARGMNELVFHIAGRLSMSIDDIKRIKNNYSNILAAYEIRD